MLSPTASNAPARDDTHPAARNVPVVGDGLLDEGARDARTHLRARSLRYVLDDVWLTCLCARSGWDGVRPHAPGRPRPRG